MITSTGPHTVTLPWRGGPTGSPEENGRIAADCRRKSELVERLWEGHLDATPTAPAGQRIEALAACLRASGVSVPEQPDEHQLREIVGVRMQDGVPQAPSEAVLRAWTSCETQLSVPR